MVIVVGWFSGCLSNEEQKLIGRWDSEAGTELNFYTELFSKKLDYVTMGISAKLDWKIDHGRIILSGDVPNAALEWDYYFNGNDIVVINIMALFPITFHRIKTNEQSSPTEKEKLSFNSIDDTFVNENVPNDNMGSALHLRVRGLTNLQIYTLVKFDVSSMPKDATIVSGTLKLFYYQEPGEGNPIGHTLNIYRITSDWNENVVTWNTQPSHEQTITSSMNIPFTPDVWVSWDVTNDVKEFIDNGETNYGWKIIDTSYDSDMPYFHSKEYGSSIPYLEIEYT